MQIREEEKKRREGEADERGGSDRSEKEVAGERWKRWEEMEAGSPAGAPAAPPQPGGRMRHWRPNNQGRVLGTSWFQSYFL